MAGAAQMENESNFEPSETRVPPSTYQAGAEDNSVAPQRGSYSPVMFAKPAVDDGVPGSPNS